MRNPEKGFGVGDGWIIRRVFIELKSNVLLLKYVHFAQTNQCINTHY